MSKSKNKLFLIDGHGLCYRSFYAIKELNNGRGQPTNAVYGFVNTIKKLLKDYDPQYMAVCFDSKGQTKRQQKFAEYKIQRPSMPDDLRSQIPIIKGIVKDFHLAVYELEGYEADDIIATIAKKASAKGLEVVIVSEDKDMYQLADDHIGFFSMRKNIIYDTQGLKQKLGFDPYNIIDFISLAGDKVDNIPGIKGVGEVTARTLINEFGSLDEILKNTEKITKKSVKAKIEEHKKDALFSKELAVLDCAVPLELEIDHMQVTDPDYKQLFETFREMGFKRLSQEYALGSDLPESPVADLLTLDNDKAFEKFLKQAEKTKQLVLFYRKTTEDLFDSCFLALDSSVAYQMDTRHLVKLKDILENKNIGKITHNVKSLYKKLQELSIHLSGDVFDVMLASFLVMPGLSSYEPSEISWEFLKQAVDEKNKAAQEPCLLFKLAEYLKKEMNDKSLNKLFGDVEMPLSSVLADMESEGVKLDEKLLSELSKECDKKIKALELELYESAGEEFNLNSPKQLSTILFEKLKMPVIKKTKTGFSTNESVLTKLAETHGFPAKILEYRQLAKLKSTYIDALPRLIDPSTGRVHAEFNQIGAETGRLSSRNPNLQNIPIRTEMGRKIRKAFIPLTKGHVLLAADYSQIELRILAHLSHDETLIKAFKNDQDIHTYTGSLIFNVDEKDVTKQMRYSMKRVNFGIIYGMSAFGLAKDLEISQHEAQEFIDKYFERYPKVKLFMDNEIKKCEETGYVLTLLNRRRYLPEIKSKNVSLRQFAQRQAINTPVQGSAADLVKLAMIDIQTALKRKNLKTKMLITVHDELVFDVPSSEKDEIIKLVREKMENTLKLSVPIKVDIKTGDNWLEMKDV